MKKALPPALLLAILAPMLLFLSGLSFQDGGQAALQVTATPTPDAARLLEPTQPANPGQADIGAYDYWLNCMPCHGDMGQGLTDEFRQLYPEEDRYCWGSGCHHETQYNKEGYGFPIPTVVPPVIAPAALEKFGNAAALFEYIHVAMPREAPASLEDDVYWQLVAFLLRENGIEVPYEAIGPENAQLVLFGDQPVPDLAATVSSADHPRAQITLDEIRELHPEPRSGGVYLWFGVAIFAAAIFFFAVVVSLMRREKER